MSYLWAQLLHCMLSGRLDAACGFTHGLRMQVLGEPAEACLSANDSAADIMRVRSSRCARTHHSSHSIVIVQLAVSCMSATGLPSVTCARMMIATEPSADVLDRRWSLAPDHVVLTACTAASQALQVLASVQIRPTEELPVLQASLHSDESLSHWCEGIGFQIHIHLKHAYLQSIAVLLLCSSFWGVLYFKTQRLCCCGDMPISTTWHVNSDASS